MAVKKKRASVLLIYTGGTIGMMQDARSGELKPFDFNSLKNQIPELAKFDIDLASVSFIQPIDSSNMQPRVWLEIAELIKSHYHKHDGFVVLHGSDTMSYTASALSFVLENLSKPVILTGSQLPIGMIRTDGKENLITAIEIAGAKKSGKPIIQEVCVYFEYKLYRGNRTFKYNSEHFDAFKSPNYPALAEAGVDIEYRSPYFFKGTKGNLKVHEHLDSNVSVLRLFPGINTNTVNAILNTKGCKAIILETYGAGNATTETWFIAALQKALQKGLVIVNVTQCLEGSVIQGMYETSTQLKKIGVISAHDMTFEAAVTKLMFLLGQNLSVNAVKQQFEKNLRGEISHSNK
jgi:L-asparaginase